MENLNRFERSIMALLTYIYGCNGENGIEKQNWYDEYIRIINLARNEYGIRGETNNEF